MGKAQRLRGRADTAAPRSVSQAAQLIDMAEQGAQLRQTASDPGLVQAGVTAHAMLSAWRDSPVALRADSDFLSALADSDTDVSIDRDCFTRVPYDALAVCFSQPLTVDNGAMVVHYDGFLAAGSRATPVEPAEHRQIPIPPEMNNGRWTTTTPLSQAETANFLWLFRIDGDGVPRTQWITMPFRGEGSRSLEDAIADQVQAVQALTEGYPGNEYRTLYAVSIQLLLYLVSAAPDLDWEPEAPARRARGRLGSARVGSVGWRVGRSLRHHDQAAGTGTPNPAERRRPVSHLRRAHWRRVRIATRDEHGTVVGDQHGQQGTDWEYQLRWFPPSWVNAADDTPVSPVVRDL